MTARRDRFRSQVTFAMVPVWVLQAAKDAQAVYLYAILSRYANKERRAWPKHERLAADMGVTERSVRRALARLKAIGAVQTTPHRRDDGTIDGTEYLLVSVPFLQRTQVSGSHVPDTPQLPPVVDLPLAATKPPDTDVRPDRTQVSGAYKEELDPSNQIQKREARVTFKGARFSVPKFLHEEFTDQLGPKAAAIFDLLAWYPRLDQQDDGPILGNVLTFIRRAFEAESKRVFGSRSVGSRPVYQDWSCPHSPQHFARHECYIHSEIERARREIA